MQPREAAERIHRCRGQGGHNLDYVVNTWKALRAMGIRDRELDRVVEEVATKTRPGAPDCGAGHGNPL